MKLQELYLPPQQKKIIGLLSQGMMPTEIGKHLGLSTNTISTHLQRLKKKLNARSTIHAAVIWIRANG